MTHSEGPWTPCFTIYDGNVVRFHITSPEFGSVRPICEGTDYNSTTLAGNAHLIAAAPNMKETLKTIRYALETGALVSVDGYCDDLLVKRLIDRVLAKAEGKDGS